MTAGPPTAAWSGGPLRAGPVRGVTRCRDRHGQWGVASGEGQPQPMSPAGSAGGVEEGDGVGLSAGGVPQPMSPSVEAVVSAEAATDMGTATAATASATEASALIILVRATGETFLRTLMRISRSLRECHARMPGSRPGALQHHAMRRLATRSEGWGSCIRTTLAQLHSR